jgi:hypothetical protein
MPEESDEKWNRVLRRAVARIVARPAKGQADREEASAIEAERFRVLVMFSDLPTRVVRDDDPHVGLPQGVAARRWSMSLDWNVRASRDSPAEAGHDVQRRYQCSERKEDEEAGKS